MPSLLIFRRLQRLCVRARLNARNSPGPRLPPGTLLSVRSAKVWGGIIARTCMDARRSRASVGPAESGNCAERDVDESGNVSLATEHDWAGHKP
jgi:hypothetical protein